MKTAEKNGTATMETNSSTALVERGQELENQTPEVVNTNIDLETWKATQEALKGLKDYKHEIELTATYLTFEAGQQQLFIYAGMTEITPTDGSNANQKLNDNGMVDAVKLLAEDGKFYINAATVVVGTLRSMKVPTPVKITCTGETKAKVGKYQTYSIKQLA